MFTISKFVHACQNYTLPKLGHFFETQNSVAAATATAAAAAAAAMAMVEINHSEHNELVQTLMVCSRTTGLESMKPLTMLGKI